MARPFAHRLRGLRAALAVALLGAPLTALADTAAFDLHEIRRALSTIHNDLAQGLNGPANVTVLWDQLPLSAAAPIAKKVQSFATFTSAPSSNDTEVPHTPTALAPFSNGSGLFSIQMSQSNAGLAPRPLPDAISIDTPVGFGRLGQIKTTENGPARAPQDVGVTNFRIPLASLAQVYTGRNNMAVLNAQGPRGPMALGVRAGIVTLADLQSYSAAHGMAPRSDGTLTAPVVIWPGATLRLTPGERLGLARDTGAFILSLGMLEIEGATIEVSGPENAFTPSFVPFITVAGAGGLRLQNATLRGLGFGQTPKFSGLSVAGNLLTQKGSDITIQDSLFDGLKIVSIAGVSGARITGNSFQNSGNITLNLVNAPNARITGNLFTGSAPTNSVKIERGSHHTIVARNMFLQGQRVAVLIDSASNYAKVRENVIWRRQGSGIKFLHTTCGLAENNVIIDNRQKGIEVRKSDGIVVRNNLIAGNNSAGVWVSSQFRDARTSLSGNILTANGSGLATATGAEILMAGNNFAKQLPRLLDGDIARLTNNVVVDLKGANTLRFKDGQAEVGAPQHSLCGSDM